MKSDSSQITTVTFFRFKGLLDKLWAFGMMQFAHYPLGEITHLQFYKLLGTGKHKFSARPDFEVYAHLMVWADEDAAIKYHTTHSLFKKYNIRAKQSLTLFMRTVTAKGAWGGGNPFEKGNIEPNNTLLAVITRATIKNKHLIRFWKYVPYAQDNLYDNSGLVFTKGIGEVPFKNMATFSLWSNQESLDSFAYQTKAHVGAIQKTRKYNWYSEELFARFQPYKFLGCWDGLEKMLMQRGLTQMN